MSTRTFLPPGETSEIVKTSASTQVFSEDDLPVPVPVKKTPVTRKRRRSSFSSPFPDIDLAKVVNTPTKRARAIFEKLDKGEGVSQRRIERELGACLPAFVTRGETESLEVALSEGADPNWNNPVTALYTAVDLKKVNYCKMLLAHGASIVKKNAGNDGRPVSLALKNPGSGVYKLFIEHIAHMEREVANVVTSVGDNDEEQPTTPLRSSPSNEPPRKRHKA